MPPINVRSWESFEKKLKEIRQAEISAGRSEDFLFRGIHDSTLPLATTLERVGLVGGRISEYYRMISRAKAQIETFTGLKWDIPTFPKLEESMRNHDTWALRVFPDQPTYSYLVYLRHHGFPSPLLDWSRSPYVAAYFAFQSKVKPRTGRVSMYMFSERPEGSKSWESGEAEIHSIGPYVTSHRRHYLQQSDYTMCVAFGNDFRFAKHDDVLARGDLKQDVLWKFNIPWVERLKVLKLLDSYGLNAFSLFGSEESLMQTLALREIELRHQT